MHVLCTTCRYRLYMETDTPLTLPLHHHDFRGLSLIWSHEFPGGPLPSASQGTSRDRGPPHEPSLLSVPAHGGSGGDPPSPQFTSPKHLTEVWAVCQRARLSVLTLCLLHILFLSRELLINKCILYKATLKETHFCFLYEPFIYLFLMFVLFFNFLFYIGV